MKKLILLAGTLVFCTNNAVAGISRLDNEDFEDYSFEEVQTIYTEVPMRSYYAYPDDVNFIPETEFMNESDRSDIPGSIRRTCL